MARTRRIVAALWALSGCAVGACSGGEVRPAAAAPRPLVEILSWWLAPGEAEALQALIAVHDTRYPDARVFNAAAASAAVSRTIVADRLAQGDPPDLLQLNARELRAVHARFPTALQSLDDLFDGMALRAVVFPEAVADVTVDGRILAMPVNLHRENALFYNKAIFAAHDLRPPTSVAELLAACATLSAAGVTPLATVHQGWILRMMFNSLVAGTMGSAGFRDYFERRSDAHLSEMRQAIDTFALVLSRYVNPDAGEDGFNWTNAAQALYNGDAAMFFHGDWAKGYLMQLGWRPGVDFGVVGSPGAADLFLYVTDSFALPRGAQNAAGARELMTTVASAAGQVAFNRLKGSSPIRGDVDEAPLDPLGRATLQELRAARIRMAAPNLPVYDDALARFVADRDAEALLRAFDENRPRRQRAGAAR